MSSRPSSRVAGGTLYRHFPTRLDLIEAVLAEGELFDVGAALLARARRSGVIVTDADEVDVLKMVGAIAWAAQGSPDGPAQADRLLALLMNGLRPGGLPRQTAER